MFRQLLVTIVAHTMSCAGFRQAQPSFTSIVAREPAGLSLKLHGMGGMTLAGFCTVHIGSVDVNLGSELIVLVMQVNQRWSDAVTSGYPTHEKLLCGSEPEIAHSAPSSCNPTAYNVTNIVKTNLEEDHHFSGTSEQLLDASVWDVSETRRSTFTCSASIAPASMAEMTRVDITGNLEPNI